MTMTGLLGLRWRLPSTPPNAHPLPASITRRYIHTPDGKLEVLCAAPSSTSSSSPPQIQPLFFIHGGFGGAHVWIPWMLFFQERGYACYAVSLRGHGQSWQPGFWRMTWGVGIGDLAGDAIGAWVGVKRWEGERRGETGEKREVEEGVEPVVIGHSSGGGLAQYMLSEGMIRTSGLVLCASVPGHGSLGVYWNWFKLDPFFPIRNWLHLMHPRSPLSTTNLVRRVFFTNGLPTADVKDFESHMPYWESMQWPIAMMKPFVSFGRIIRNISGWASGSRVCVVAGAQDKIVSVPVCQTLAGHLRNAVKEQGGRKKIELVSDSEDSAVNLVVVERGPHHFQNDLVREDAAKKVLEFLKAL